LLLGIGDRHSTVVLWHVSGWRAEFNEAFPGGGLVRGLIISPIFVNAEPANALLWKHMMMNRSPGACCRSCRIFFGATPVTGSPTTRCSASFRDGSRGQWAGR